MIPAIVGGAVLRTLVVEAVFRSGLRTGHHRDAGGAGVDVQDVHPLRLPLGGGISGLALSRRRPLLCEDSDTDQRVDAAACRKVGVKSMIVTPLLHGPEVVGVLKVVSARPRQFTTQDQLALELLAAPFDATISNAGRLQTTYQPATTDPVTGLGQPQSRPARTGPDTATPTPPRRSRRGHLPRPRPVQSRQRPRLLDDPGGAFPSLR